MIVELKNEQRVTEEWMLMDVINQLLDKPLIIQLPILKKTIEFKQIYEKQIFYLLIWTLSITFNAFRADHPPIET